MVAPTDSAPGPTRSTVFAAVGLGAAAVAAVALVDPHQGHYPRCPLLTLTGLYCPLCGGLRATFDLAHLDVGAALARNPLVVALAPVVVVAWLLWAQQAFSGRRLLVAPAWWGTALLVVLVCFGVLRNIPGWDWLSPA